MNASLSTRCVCGFLLSLFVLCCLSWFSGGAWAAESALEPAVSSGPMLQANIVWEFASDRGRMIQASCVIVALGCAMMWWMK
jgi:hypothetical protein